MAVQNPPHLNCIAPYDGLLDPYRDWAMPGGLINQSFLGWYESRIRDSHAFGPVPAAARFIEFDLRLELLRHALLDDFWFMRSPGNYLEQIRVPVLAMASQLNPYSGHSRLLRRHADLPGSSMLLLTDSMEQLLDDTLLREELLPFYEDCFAGSEPDAPVAGSRIRIKVRNHDQQYQLDAWPPASVRFQALQLTGSDNGNGTLSSQRPAGSSRSSEYANSATAQSLVFRSPPLARDLVITGPLLLELHASSTGTDTAFEVELAEEQVQRQLPAAPVLPSFLDPSPNPAMQALGATTKELVASGRLKASLRALATPAGPDFQPEHAFDQEEAPAAGRIYRYELPLSASAYRFRAGNRIVLKVRQPAEASLRGRAGTDTLYHDASYNSRLLLPVLPDPGQALSTTAPLFLPEPIVDTGPVTPLFDNRSPVILLPSP